MRWEVKSAIEEPSLDSVKRDFRLVKIEPPACLVTAVDGDLRSANLHNSGHLAIWLPWGSADSDENVFYATNGVDDYFAGRGLGHANQRGLLNLRFN